MILPTAQRLSLTSTWFIRPGCEAAADAALHALAAAVEREEPDTLVYLVHRPHAVGTTLQSLPPVDARSVLFFEIYRDAEAFQRHVSGPVFTSFVREHGELFVQSNGAPFTFVEFMVTLAGFVRPGEAGASPSPASSQAATANRHPGVMFEVIARDQAALTRFYTEVFGWQYALGASGFAYVPFALQTTPLLGGIGQTEPDTPGYAPGTHFYLRVDDLDAAIERAVRAGGKRLVDPTVVDGYTFAMVTDPEGNAIGLIKPF
ncbi:VOC family protein [Paraburkholderia pallida]|uniref:VOC family protein n=1 Tax=Paraburkholderia pallida TaxID=2547399 RepID=A0A4V1AZG0_9BURK|nr:VOC family protein [Paraburkholderia pallida]QBQ99142.1 VOC family protein [Paraburkholderia pallida]